MSGRKRSAAGHLKGKQQFQLHVTRFKLAVVSEQDCPDSHTDQKHGDTTRPHSVGAWNYISTVACLKVPAHVGSFRSALRTARERVGFLVVL